MKRTALWIALMLSTAAQAAPWTYRGTLNDGGAPANGRYDIRLSLLDAGGAKSLAYPLTFSGVEVKDGAFALDVDFGTDLTQFGALKLKTEVAQGGSGFVALGEPKAFDAKAALGSVCWDTAGNAGTSSMTDFVGTTDNQALNLRANNQNISRLQAFALPGAAGGYTANVIQGSPENNVVVGVRGATIAGGGARAGDSEPLFLGESPNSISDHYGVVAGGFANQAGNGDGNFFNAAHGAVGGGFGNVASGATAAVAGGQSNTASNGSSAVGGGFDNTAAGASSSVIGGTSNIASGTFSVASGGFSNCAGGDYSWAGGNNARVRPGNEASDLPCEFGGTSGDSDGDEGTFVWSDSTGSIVSTGPDQFLFSAAGGVAINGTPPNANGGFEFSIYGNSPDGGFVEFSLIPKLSLNGNTGERIELGVGPGGAGNNDASFRIAHRNNAGNYFERVLLNPTGSVEIRSSTSNAAQGVTMAAGAGSWSSLSDRNVKTGIAPTDTRAVLDKLVAMPVSEWSYKAQGEGVRHIGPMAQDFAAAFGVGENDTTISTVDADGVALAAIQGLNAKLEAELAQSRAQNAQLQTQLEQFAMRLAALEAAKEQ